MVNDSGLGESAKQLIAERIQRILAQRAYDLACHVIDHLSPYVYDTATKEQDYWDAIPDITDFSQITHFPD